MLTLVELEAKDFMGITKVEIPFPKHGVIIFHGEIRDEVKMESNGAGKSTLIDALSYAIFGRTVRNVTKKDLQEHSRNNKGYARVVFTLGNGKKVQIIRWVHKSKAEISIDGKEIKLNSDAVSDLIGTDYQTFANIHVLTKQDSFVFETVGARQKLFEKFVGLDVIINAMKKSIKTTKDDSFKETQRLTGSIQTLEAELTEVKNSLKQSVDIEGLQTRFREWSNIRQAVTDINNRYYELISHLADLKIILQQNRRTQLNTIILNDAELRRRQMWAQKDLVSNKALLKTVKVGTCGACGTPLPRDKVQAEINRVLTLIKANKASIEVYLQGLVDASDKISELKAGLETSDSKFSNIRQDAELFKFKLNKLGGLVADAFEVVNRQYISVNTHKDLLKQNESELVDNVKTRRKELANAARICQVAGVGAGFVDGDLREILLEGYLKHFNKDLKTTLKLFSGFSGYFTKDFEIIIRNRPFNFASTGEQMRFVLATYMNLFRYCGVNKNRFNILAFDDFDLGVDEAGRRSLAEVFEMLGETLLVFVLSQSDSYNGFPASITAIREKKRIRYELEGF